MKYYTKITYWENKNRLNDLIEFRNMVIEYFNNIKYTDFGFEIIENPKAREIRTKINLMINRIHKIILSSGINPSIFYSPPPAIGGISGSIDLIYNMFYLHQYKIKPDNIIDIIDRSIGIYIDNTINSLIRTINPFYWLGLLIDYIASLPFRFIGTLGYDRLKAENSILGRMIKALISSILSLITYFYTFLSILDYLGYLDSFKSKINSLMQLLK